MFLVHLYPHRHIDESRNTAPYACPCHKRQCLHLVLEKLHHIIVAGRILNVIEILRSSVHRPGKHVAHLHFHHQRQGNQEDRQDILHYDEYLAQYHFVTAPERAFNHVNGLITRCRDSRKEPVDYTQNQNAGDIRQDIPRCHHEGQSYAGVSHAQHQLVRIAGGNQAVHHRDQKIGQQQRRPKAYSSKGHGFADVLPQDSAFVGSQQAPGGHFLGPLARKRQTQVHIVENGR